jgi:hypothetical protein
VELYLHSPKYIFMAWCLSTGKTLLSALYRKDEIERTCSTYGNRENARKRLVGRPEGKRDHLGVRGVGGKMILKWILRIWLRIGPNAWLS